MYCNTGSFVFCIETLPFSTVMSSPQIESHLLVLFLFHNGHGHFPIQYCAVGQGLAQFDCMNSVTQLYYLQFI